MAPTVNLKKKTPAAGCLYFFPGTLYNSLPPANTVKGTLVKSDRQALCGAPGKAPYFFTKMPYSPVDKIRG